MKSLHCGQIYNSLMLRNMNIGSSLLFRSIHKGNFMVKSSVPKITFPCGFHICSFNTSLSTSSQNRHYSEEKTADISEKLNENSFKHTENPAQVFSKYESDVQFDMIKTFITEESSLPSFEKWIELRQNVCSIKGGKVKENSIDGIILSNCLHNLEMTKSFIQFLNQKYKKINAHQVSQLFKSFYLNKEKCPPDDLVFIKKTFGAFIQEKKITMVPSTVEGLVSGISITDEWKRGALLLEAAGTTQSTAFIPLIEAAISHNDIEFAKEYLRKLLKVVKSVPDCLLEYWVLRITTRCKMDEFLDFLRESNTIMNKTTADMLVTQSLSYPHLYTCTYTSIDSYSSQCHHCRRTLDPLRLNPDEFERLKSVFLNRTLVGPDIFHKTTPRELLKFMDFLDMCNPYDIVLDALNVAHLGGPRRQPDTLARVVSHYLDRGAKPLVLGRVHMLRWPKAIVRMLQERCQFFYVDNISQDDPYLLYAAMHGGPNTKFISRDLMRSHIYLLQDPSLRATFLKWQQLNQVIILSVNGPKLKIRTTPTHVLHAHCSSCANDKQHWHIPYREEVEELTFEMVYSPKSTWLCLQSKENSNR